MGTLQTINHPPPPQSTKLLKMASITANTSALRLTKATRALKGRTSIVTKATASDAKPAKAATGSGKAPEFCYGLPGSTAPMGEFDPFNLTKGKSEAIIRRYREAELTHGRVAMLASVGFIVGENFNPFFDGTITGPAVGHFQQLPSNFWVFVLGLIGLTEYLRLRKGWAEPEKGSFFTLKPDYDMGSLGWDPLSLKPTDAGELAIMQTKELNHGRLAMFAIMGEIAQELVSGTELFNLEDDGLLNDANCPPGVICNILEASG